MMLFYFLYIHLKKSYSPRTYFMYSIVYQDFSKYLKVYENVIENFINLILLNDIIKLCNSNFDIVLTESNYKIFRSKSFDI